MKIVRFAINNKTSYGILEGESIQSIEGEPYSHIKPSGQKYQLKEVKLLAPCTPSKIPSVGVNYRTSAEELKIPLRKEPFIFSKPPTAVIGPEENIIYHPDLTRVDYEGELAIVIKKQAWQISEEEALDYVLGYTCFNDVTARDLHDRELTRAKSYNTFAAFGPYIDTEFDPSNFTLETYLNGKLKQQTDASDLVFGIPKIVSFISRIMTLLPGDIIPTGSPSGVGPMQPGDTVEIKIEPLATLRNYVVKSSG